MSDNDDDDDDDDDCRSFNFNKLRADYWKSTGRKRCDYCSCWIADNKPSIEFHEGGKKHKENVQKRLKEIYKRSAKDAKQSRKLEDDMRKMEAAANAAYLKDIEGNFTDLTAGRLTEEKLKRIAEPPKKPSAPSTAKTSNEPDWRATYGVPEANPRYAPTTQSLDNIEYDLDPCDPYYEQKKKALQKKREKAEKRERTAAERKAKQEERALEEAQRKAEKARAQAQSQWHEAKGPKGYSYYWNTVTHQSVWEPPAEGFVSLAEQARQAQEQAIQEQFLQEIDAEGAEDKAVLAEEQRANAQRERLREIKRQRQEAKRRQTAENNRSSGGAVEDEPDSDEEAKVLYLRDYSVPEKPQPYGAWQVVRTTKPVDLQVPEVKPKRETKAPVFEEDSEPEDEAPSFTEKVIDRVERDSDDDQYLCGSTLFKKRKFGSSSNKRRNVRQRTADD